MHILPGTTRAETLRWLKEHHLWEALESVVSQPLLPLPDNFTSPTRVPWGGTKILTTYKQGLPIRPEKRFPFVGESWEISADPAAPSQFLFALGQEQIVIDLIQLLDLFPEQILGTGIARKFQGQNPILTKIIDAADELSVQVHPSDAYAGLRPDESGKPESWFILEAEPGCGLYLGLRDGVSKEDLRRALEQQEDVSRMLNFCAVHPGDFFVIDAGVIHAIGAGVTLIEPQKIAPKRSGKTYRLWDWNRTYDTQGRKDPQGTPRDLHIKESLDVIHFDGLRGEAFLRAIQPERRVCQRQGRSAETVLVESENFGASHLELHAGDRVEQNCTASFHGIIPYAGRMTIAQGERTLCDVPCGQAVILPAALQTYTLTGDDARAIKVYYPEQYLAGNKEPDRV